MVEKLLSLQLLRGFECQPGPSLQDHLDCMFAPEAEPLVWDSEKMYTRARLEVYYLTYAATPLPLNSLTEVRRCKPEKINKLLGQLKSHHQRAVACVKLYARHIQVAFNTSIQIACHGCKRFRIPLHI